MSFRNDMKGRTDIEAYCQIYTDISLGSRFGDRRVPLRAERVKRVLGFER